MKPFVFTLVLLAASLFAPAAEPLPGAKRVLILGDSITYAGLYANYIEAWFATRHPERRIEFLNLGLPSETVSGLSEPGHAGGKFPRPGLHERLERILPAVKPDLIFACYGMNCGIYHPLSEERFAAYRNGILKLREKAAAIGAKVIHVTPPVFDPLPIRKRTKPAGLKEYVGGPYEGYNDVLDKYSEWLVSKRADGWKVTDLHTAMNQYITEQRKTDPNFALARDGVHCNATGHWLIAREILRHIGATDVEAASSVEDMLSTHRDGKQVLKLISDKQKTLKLAWLTETKHIRPGIPKGKPVTEASKEAEQLDAQLRKIAAPFPGKKSSWNGFDRYLFPVKGKTASVVVPQVAAPGKPWVWHGEFFGHKPAPDIALLKKGFHIVYLSVPNMLGSPQAVEHWNDLYAELTGDYGFGKKPALVGLSRGGLYCYNWAIANPDKVSCIYGDAPVCDFKSWPGGFGKGKGSKRDWELVMKLWNFKTKEEALAYQGNPVDNLKPLADANIPLLHVFGDADDVVPWEENTGLIAERYKKLGGKIQLIRKPGIGHHPHGLDDSTRIVEFLSSLP